MFVPRYLFPRYNVAKQDFKGHQLKALRKLDVLKPQIQLICEIRDIRAPLSTRNVLIDKVMDKRIHNKLVIYTRKDLMAGNQEYLDKLGQWHEEIGENYMMINGKRPSDVTNVFKTLKWYKQQHEQRLDIPLPLGYKVLVSGMPNVGKSTLINSLRALTSKGKKVARTGAEAGITRATSELIRISEEHQIYLIDSPGIGLPGRLNSGDKMIVLSLCGCIKQGIVDSLVDADYLLYLMNLQRDARSRWYPDMDRRPTNDIYEVLERLRRNKNSSLEDIARSWIQKTADGLIFDKELLLSPHEFSLKDYVAEQLEMAKNLDIPVESSRKSRNNSIFGQRR